MLARTLRRSVPIASTLALVLGLLAAPPAGARPAAVADLDQQLQEQIHKEELLADDWLQQRVTLAATQRSVAHLQARMRGMEPERVRLQAAVDRVGAEIYMHGPAAGMALVFDADDPGAALRSMEALNRVARDHGDLITEYEGAKAALATTTAQLEQARQLQARELAEIERKKAAIDREVARTTRLVEAARAREQARAAARAAAARSAPAPAPTTTTPPPPTTLAPATTVPAPPSTRAPAPTTTTRPAPPPARPPAPPPARQLPRVSGDIAKVIAYARAQIGKPYQWGAAGPDAFDCSGLTMRAYAQIGVSLPHCSACQARLGRQVPASQRQPGDLIWRPGHITLYIGGGKQIAATHTGDYVRLQPAGDGQYIRVRG